MNKRTKIVATIGPASSTGECIGEMIKAGMNVARLNFSHGTQSEQKKKIDIIRSLDNQVGILQDIAGPKIRIGEIDGDQVRLLRGQQFILTEEIISGNAGRVTVNLPEFSQYVQPGDRILLNDGIIELLVIKIIDREVYCRVESEGMLSSRKGISLPFTSGRLKLLSKKDISDIKFGIEQKVDYIAISFVRNAADVKEVKEIILSAGAKIPVIAKIEKPEALDNFTEILAEADGIMIARGDLGVEVPFEQVPVIQKKLIKQTNKACKPVITATQMLASMVENLRPSRAEVTDVANAILDGTDAVMLSEETAIGKNPVLSVQTMSKLAKEVEKSLNRTYDLNAISEKEHPLPDLHVAENACRLAYGTNAKVIVCFTLSGSTALKVSRFRPRMPVLALTQDIRTCRQLSLSWGVLPVMINPVNSLLEVLRDAREKITANRLAEAKDRFVVTAGIPFNEKGNTNLSGTFTV